MPPIMMSHVALGGLVAFFAVRDIKFRSKAREAAICYRKAAKAFEETVENHEAQIRYLCHLLEENDVPVDEFDLIALHFNQ